MPTKAQRNSETDNESKIDGSMHLIQCTGTGPDGKNCVAWKSIWLPKRRPINFMDRPFLCGFCAAARFEECKTSPPSKNADIMSLFCADSNEQHGRRANIRIFQVEEINDEDVYERVVKVAKDIGVTIPKQDIKVYRRQPSRNP